MKIIVTNIDTLANAVRASLVSGDPLQPECVDIGCITEAQLRDTIESLVTAQDKRYPEAMAQVSPRAVAVALAVLQAVERAP